MDSIRQQRVAQEIQKTLSNIFLTQGPNYYGSAFVTITHVSMTPDLLIARIYISIFDKAEVEKIIHQIRTHTSDIRYRLGKAMSSMRRLPELEFHNDDLMEEQYRINDLLKDL